MIRARMCRCIRWNLAQSRVREPLRSAPAFCFAQLHHQSDCSEAAMRRNSPESSPLRCRSSGNRFLVSISRKRRLNKYQQGVIIPEKCREEEEEDEDRGQREIERESLVFVVVGVCVRRIYVQLIINHRGYARKEETNTKRN